jgi:hypothetical protein
MLLFFDSFVKLADSLAKEPRKSGLSGIVIKGAGSLFELGAVELPINVTGERINWNRVWIYLLLTKPFDRPTPR